jgi:hypothetical protein
MNVLVAVDGKGDDTDTKQEQGNKLRRVNEGDRRSVMTELLMYCCQTERADTVKQWCYCGTVLVYGFTYMAGVAQSV